MKSVVLATIAIAVYTGMLTLLFRVLLVRERAALMAALFFLSVPLFIWLHLSTPPNLWVLPAWLTEQSRVMDLLFGLIVYGAGFFGGVLQLYNLSDRGLSLRMLIDIGESRGGLLPETMMVQYGAGQGIDWMYEKRISDMLSRGLVVRQGEGLNLTARGARIAGIFTALRQYLRLDN